MPANEFDNSRRRFLKTSATIAAASTLPAWFTEESRSRAATTRPLSPNDKPNIALIGCGGQGRHDATLAGKFANVVLGFDGDPRSGLRVLSGGKNRFGAEGESQSMAGRA